MNTCENYQIFRQLQPSNYSARYETRPQTMRKCQNRQLGAAKCKVHAQVSNQNTAPVKRAPTLENSFVE